MFEVRAPTARRRRKTRRGGKEVQGRQETLSNH
jgi:hypothetical protein